MPYGSTAIDQGCPVLLFPADGADECRGAIRQIPVHRAGPGNGKVVLCAVIGQDPRSGFSQVTRQCPAPARSYVADQPRSSGQRNLAAKGA